MKSRAAQQATTDEKRKLTTNINKNLTQTQALSKNPDVTQRNRYTQRNRNTQPFPGPPITSVQQYDPLFKNGSPRSISTSNSEASLKNPPSSPLSTSPRSSSSSDSSIKTPFK